MSSQRSFEDETVDDHDGHDGSAPSHNFELDESESSRLLIFPPSANEGPGHISSQLDMAEDEYSVSQEASRTAMDDFTYKRPNFLLTNKTVIKPSPKIRKPPDDGAGHQFYCTGDLQARMRIRYITFAVVIHSLALLLSAFGYYSLRQSLNDSDSRVSLLSSNMVEMSNSYISDQKENRFILTDLNNQLLEQHTAIKHLSNLSNAYVLDVLQNTKLDLYDQLTTIQSAVQSDVDMMQSNVTDEMSRSRAAVRELLTRSAHELKQAQSNMTMKLLQTKQEYDAVASKLVIAVTTVRQNVTQQLDQNTIQLRAVVDMTNRAVQSAQRNFTSNLAMSRQELATAMRETDATIAAAEMNVTAKLAKSAIDFKAAVITATHQLDDLQRNVSSSLALMSGTLLSTSADLNAQVESAKVTIHEEVQAVQESIEDYVAFTDKKFASENDFVRYQLAGTFTLLGCLISLWHLTSHLRHYYKPEVQRRVMAVLWMVPIYSVTSWLSLVFPRYDAVFASVRDCYEAYAVYTFIALLIAILEDGQGLQELLNKLALHVVEERRALSEAIAKRSRRPAMHLTPPFPCCYTRHRPASVAATWLFQCQLMTMQFVMMKPILTALPFILRLCSSVDYDNRPPILNNAINPYSPKLYIQLAENLSVAMAFYALLSFFHGTEKDLAWCDPWPKFLCIKGVVFMTFWQGFVIQVMGGLGLVEEKAALQIQNLLICIEMLIASLAHFYIFPYHEWQEGYKREKEKSILLRDTLALRDFVKDMKMMVTTWETGPESARNTGSDKQDGDKGKDEGGEGDQDGGDEEDEVTNRHDGRSSTSEHGQQQYRAVSNMKEEGALQIDDALSNCSSDRHTGSRSSLISLRLVDDNVEDIEMGRQEKGQERRWTADTSTRLLQPMGTGLGALQHYGTSDYQRDERPRVSPSSTQQSKSSKRSGSTSYSWTTSRSRHGPMESSGYSSLAGDDCSDSDALAAALGSIDRNMIELGELGLDMGSSETSRIEERSSSGSPSSTRSAGQSTVRSSYHGVQVKHTSTEDIASYQNSSRQQKHQQQQSSDLSDVSSAPNIWSWSSSGQQIASESGKCGRNSGLESSTSEEMQGSAWGDETVGRGGKEAKSTGGGEGGGKDTTSGSASEDDLFRTAPAASANTQCATDHHQPVQGVRSLPLSSSTSSSAASSTDHENERGKGGSSGGEKGLEAASEEKKHEIDEAATIIVTTGDSQEVANNPLPVNSFSTAAQRDGSSMSILSEDDVSADLDMMSCESRDPSIVFDSAIVRPYLAVQVHVVESLSDESIPVSLLGSALCSPRDGTRVEMDRASQPHSHWMIGEGEGEISLGAEGALEGGGDFAAGYPHREYDESDTNPALSASRSPSSLLPTRARHTSISNVAGHLPRARAKATVTHGGVDTPVGSPVRVNTMRGVDGNGDGVMMIETEMEADTGTDSGSGSMLSGDTPNRLTGVVLLEEESV